MTDTVLVLGATGKTGRRLLAELAVRGAQDPSRQPAARRGLIPFD